MYIPRSSPLYDKNFKRLTKKNAVLKERTLMKIREILDNPEIGETLKSGSVGAVSIQAEAILAASTSQAHVIQNPYDEIKVEVMDGSGHASYTIDYLGGR